MVHGIAAVHDVESATAWMDRAWTLQETVVKWQKTYIYIRCPSGQQTVRDPSDLSKSYTFMKVKRAQSMKTGTSLFLVAIADLLELADIDRTKISLTTPLPPVAVLNGDARHPKTKKPIASDSSRRALRAAFSKYPCIKYTGVWRSMFRRTVSHPVDVVYSIMGIFKPTKTNCRLAYLNNHGGHKCYRNYDGHGGHGGYRGYNGHSGHGGYNSYGGHKGYNGYSG